MRKSAAQAVGRQTPGVPRAASSTEKVGNTAPWLLSFVGSRMAYRMTTRQPNNPLHGITLEKLLTELVERYGWAELGRRIDIRCFNHEPGIASSLKFLRRTPWAREQVEALYLSTLRGNPSRNPPKA